MSALQWPTDKRFRRIAAKIADSVLQALAAGAKVSAAGNYAGSGCLCPLGCVPGAASMRPSSSFQPNILARLGMRANEHEMFACGFDSRLEAHESPESVNLWRRLGAAYRARFP